jgi:fumarate reductase flavoprotein subunit
MKHILKTSVSRVLMLAVTFIVTAGFSCIVQADQLFNENIVKSHQTGTKSSFLAGAHGKMGMDCSSCHKEARIDDSERSINKSCTECHGGLAAVAKKTSQEINPHKSHLGEINCTSCHGGHEASVVYCSSCHKFNDMKISHNNGAKPKSQRDDWSKYSKVKPAHTENTDILIIGSGASGFTAALAANDYNVKTIIVEKMPIPGGNSQLAAGGMNAAGTPYQAQKGINDNPELMFNDTMKGGKNINNPELVKILAEQSADSIKWLADRGAVLDSPGMGGGASAARMHGPSGGAFVGPYLSAFFRNQVKNKNIDLRVNSKAIRLVTDASGAVTGAIIKGKHSGYYQINAKAVVLATGGFGANSDMVAQFRPELRHTATSNQPGTQGDGIRMGKEIGAAVVDLKEIQVNPTLLADSPVIVSEIVRGAGAVFVNRDGVRFISELTTRDVTSAAIFKQKGGSVFMIFDQQVRDKVKQLSAAFELQKAYEGNTIAELASAIKVNPSVLEKTISRYNSFVDAKSDLDFKRPDLSRKVNAPKFYAIEVKPAIHYTMGGLKFNTQGQVINTNGQPIKGLYAAGEVTGGVHGANRLGGNSISQTITFGRIAGVSAAKAANAEK